MSTTKISRVALLGLLPLFVILLLPVTCDAEQILRKNNRKILGSKIENENKFKSCRGKIIEIGSGTVQPTNIKCGCSTCPPTFGMPASAIGWAERIARSTVRSRSNGRFSHASFQRKEKQAAPEAAQVLMRSDPMVASGRTAFIGTVTPGRRFRTCDGKLMDIQSGDKLEKTNLSCTTNVSSLKHKLLKDPSHVTLEDGSWKEQPRTFLGVLISPKLFLTCDQQVHEVTRLITVEDTDLECDCNTCDEEQEEPKKPT